MFSYPDIRSYPLGGGGRGGGGGGAAAAAAAEEEEEEVPLFTIHSVIHITYYIITRLEIKQAPHSLVKLNAWTSQRLLNRTNLKDSCES